MGADRTSIKEGQTPAVSKALTIQAPVVSDELTTAVDKSINRLIHGQTDTAEQAALFLALVSGEAPELLVDSLETLLGYEGNPHTMRSLMFALGNVGTAYPEHADRIESYVASYTEASDPTVSQAVQQVLADLDRTNQDHQ